MAFGMLRGLAALVACTSILTADPAGAALAARSAPPSFQAPTLAAIAKLQRTGSIGRAEASADRATVARAVRLIDRLPRGRAQPVAAALGQVDAIATELTPPRALVLFGQLAVNNAWFARHGPPSPSSDVTDSQGVVYRYFPGTAFEFHPLANFTALNNDATSKNASATARLAAALEARGVPGPGGGTAWEYYFAFSGGSAPWISGFSQAIAAQAFARASKLLPSQASGLLAEANAAFRTIPGHLDERLAFGTWIKEYAFSRTAVLNAQLQTAISLASYASLSGNSEAQTLAASLRNAAARGLSRFDAGSWTYYSLAPRTLSPFSYQTYVVQLLQRLARTDSRFAPAAARFAGFARTPPLLRLANGASNTVEFWVSKPCSVRVTGLGQTRRLTVDGGWTTLLFTPMHAGVFPVELEATDWAGEHARAQALPIVEVVAQPEQPTVNDGGAAVAPAPEVGASHQNAAGDQSLEASDGRIAIGFPHSLSPDGPVRVRVSCGAACLYLVVLQRVYDRAPVLATRGALPAGTGAIVELARGPIDPGMYRFVVWVVLRADPSTMLVERGSTLTRALR
jgi:hypothetical protein